MKRNVYTEKIINKCCIKYRNGIAVRDIVIETGVPRSTIYYWLKQYGDIDTSEEITYKKSFENMQRKYEKERQICEVLKAVNCTSSSPLKTKLYELEKLYGQYSVYVLSEALGVSRGTIYNHVLRNK